MNGLPFHFSISKESSLSKYEQIVMVLSEFE